MNRNAGLTFFVCVASMVVAGGRPCCAQDPKAGAAHGKLRLDWTRGIGIAAKTPPVTIVRGGEHFHYVVESLDEDGLRYFPDGKPLGRPGQYADRTRAEVAHTQLPRTFVTQIGANPDRWEFHGDAPDSDSDPYEVEHVWTFDDEAALGRAVPPFQEADTGNRDDPPVTAVHTIRVLPNLGRIRVTVGDAQGHALARATVSLRDARGEELQRVWTTRDGVAELRMVDPGPGTIQVAAKGYVEAHAKNVQVEVGSETKVAMTLQLP